MPALWPIPSYSCTRYHSLSVARIYISSNYIWPCTSPPNKHSEPLTWKAQPYPTPQCISLAMFRYFLPDSQVVLRVDGTSVASHLSPRHGRLQAHGTWPNQQKYKGSVSETTKITHIFDFKEVKQALWPRSQMPSETLVEGNYWRDGIDRKREEIDTPKSSFSLSGDKETQDKHIAAWKSFTVAYINSHLSTHTHIVPHLSTYFQFNIRLSLSPKQYDTVNLEVLCGFQRWTADESAG